MFVLIKMLMSYLVMDKTVEMGVAAAAMAADISLGIYIAQ
jgi:hypothetical protein